MTAFETLLTQPLDAAPYVRTVEVVALDTLCRLMDAKYQHFELEKPATNIYSRAPESHLESVAIARLHDIDLLPHPAWKICGEDRYLVEEIGHTTKLTIRGVEHWAGWNGKHDIRYGEAHVAELGASQGAAISEPGPAVLIGGDVNHYHWLLNFVPRLMTLELALAAGEPLKNARLLVPEQVSDNALSLLLALGYPQSRIVRVKSGAAIRFDQLYVPSFFPHFEVSPNVSDWYARKLLRRRKPGPPAQRIVISRGDIATTSQRRRVMNEAAMVSALEPLGFKPHNLGLLSMDEQIDLFLDAEFVVGPHGAGFANMVLCQPGAKAIVLENSWNHTFMMDMLNASGARSEVMVCEDVVDAEFEATHGANPALADELRRNRDMTVDTADLVRRVKAMLA